MRLDRSSLTFPLLPLDFFPLANVRYHRVDHHPSFSLPSPRPSPADRTPEPSRSIQNVPPIPLDPSLMTSNVPADKSRRRVNILSIKKKLLPFRQPCPLLLIVARIRPTSRVDSELDSGLHMRAEQTKPLNRAGPSGKSVRSRPVRRGLPYRGPRLPAGWNGHLAETRPPSR